MHFWGNVKWGSHCGNSLKDPQNLNIESPYTQAILLCVQIKKNGIEGLERFAHPNSQQCDSQQPEGGNTPAVHEQIRDE